jgi:bifunctional non-homologous end joining protein LigD
VEVSNADRVVFPEDGITKGDVFEYYARVAERMLPYIEGRALSVERFPRGIGGQGFMQKNVPDHAPEELIGRHEVAKEDGGATVYPVVGSTDGIAFFANLGVITFHVPPVKVDDDRHPDWVIWDLDPPPGRVDLVRAAAGAMRSFLDRHSIPTRLLSSGSKGYHLRARVQPTVDAETAARFARGAAALAAAGNDDLMTLAFRKKDRGGRVFVDWLRNASYSTSVAPYSLRPRPGASVAAPLHWDELDTVEPDEIRLADIEVRLQADPWASIESIDLTDAVLKVDTALDQAGIVLEPFDRFRA